MLLLLPSTPKLYQTFWTEEQLERVKGESMSFSSWKDLLTCHNARMKWLALWYRKNWSVNRYSELPALVSSWRIFPVLSLQSCQRDSSNFISRQTLKKKYIQSQTCFEEWNICLIFLMEYIGWEILINNLLSLSLCPPWVIWQINFVSKMYF